VTTYSQSLVVYNDAVTSAPGHQWLTPLYALARRAPGCPIVFTGTGTLANVSLTIPAPADMTDALTFGGYGKYDPRSADATEQRRRADLLFRHKQTITVTCDDYSAYAHASYYVERHKIRHKAHLVFAPGVPDYYAPP